MPDVDVCSGLDTDDSMSLLEESESESIQLDSTGQWQAWQLLPNDVWIHIIGQLQFVDKLVRAVTRALVHAHALHGPLYTIYVLPCWMSEHGTRTGMCRQCMHGTIASHQYRGVAPLFVDDCDLWRTAMQALQQTCRLLHELLAKPVTSSTWGRLDFTAPKAAFSRSDLLQRSRWVQRRLKGALYL